VSWLFAALLACAVAIVVAAEWPRIDALVGPDRRRRRNRAKRKEKFRVVETESDDFAASVQRDLENLPTIEERDRR
jgi:predicted outer membrane lipoprotein